MDMRNRIAFTIALLISIGLGVGIAVVYTYMSELPEVGDMMVYRPSLATRLYDINGNYIDEYFIEKRTWISLDKIPDQMVQATIAIEDERFYLHGGIDTRGILRAFLVNIRHRRIKEGASTITMQLTRSRFLTRERTFKRKLREAVQSLKVEQHYTKHEILEMYLNQIYYGNGAYGVESAARTYFGKHAIDLSLGECAMLAGIPNRPLKYNPYHNPVQADKRKKLVLNKMADQKYVSRDECIEACFAPISLARTEIQNAPYFTEYVRTTLEKKYGTTMVYHGGLQVYTTLDLGLQDIAQRTFMTGIATATDKARRAGSRYRGREDELQGAMLGIDPHTGFIKVMIGGRNYKKSVFNRAVQARRQPGSSFKPILYTAAMENGFTMASTLLDVPRVFSDYEGREWRPRNFSNKYRGKITLHEALQHSVNLVAVQLMAKVGVRTVTEYARRMGLSKITKRDLSLALGSSEASLLEMVGAFSVLANAGVRMKPLAIHLVKDSQGQVLEENFISGEPVISPQAAYVMVHTMQDVINLGTGRNIRRLGFRGTAAGKTGTSSDFVDAWFIGFTQVGS